MSSQLFFREKAARNSYNMIVRCEQQCLRKKNYTFDPPGSYPVPSAPCEEKCIQQQQPKDDDIINWLAENRAESLRKNIEFIPEFGRYDDLVSLIGTACEKDALRTIRKQLEADLASDAEVSLLAKWLPSVNASNAETVRKAKRIARYLGMSDAEYRKTLVELRKKIRIIENHLREKDYSFDYAKQPSKAMFKYRKAFLRNDGERYNAFLEAVSSGEKQLHADNLAPYEIVRSALNANRWGFHADLTVGEKAALNASWASLPDFCDNRNALAVVDTSGSMYCYDNALPAAVALSLGLYFGERNTGIFHNHFIEFSSRPQLIEIKGKTFAERLEYFAILLSSRRRQAKRPFPSCLSCMHPERHRALWARHY